MYINPGHEAQLALVFVLSGMVQRLSSGMATTLFMLYSALTGLTLSSIFIVYTYSSIASTFVVTGGSSPPSWRTACAHGHRGTAM